MRLGWKLAFEKFLGSSGGKVPACAGQKGQVQGVCEMGFCFWNGGGHLPVPVSVGLGVEGRQKDQREQEWLHLPKSSARSELLVFLFL